jgi:hypothetical protein
MAKKNVELVFDAEILESVDSVESAVDALGEQITLATSDAAETMVFARQLETVKARVYEKKYPPLKARSFVDESNEGGATSDTLVYRVWEAFVVAKVSLNYATDIPMVAASGKEMVVRYFPVRDGYYYSIEDLRKAQAAGVELSTKYALIARRGIELARDGITAFGVPDIGTFGIANHPNATLRVLPNGNWESANGLAILADLNDLVTDMLDESLEIFEPNTILLSTRLYRIVTTKLVSADGNDAGHVSVLDLFKKQNPGIRVESWTKLKASAPDGTHDRVICYHKSPEVMEFETGVEFEILPVEYSKGVFSHVCQARYAGVQIHYPLAVSYSDNA